MIWVNEPTAYMVPPHWASCRTCSVVEPVVASCGVPTAGVDDTGPVAAWAGTASQASANRTADTKPEHAIRLRRHRFFM